MEISTAKTNELLNSLSVTVSAGNRAGLKIGAFYQDNYYCVICMEKNINCAIDLHENIAPVELNSLLLDLFAIVPSSQRTQGTSS
ncbi:MAG: hypothetical protein HRT38_10280 [Alteromonadaceae bacterium]|nr:hypothetical protein [Alteromonadaceae bacterium]